MKAVFSSIATLIRLIVLIILVVLMIWGAMAVFRFDIPLGTWEIDGTDVRFALTTAFDGDPGVSLKSVDEKTFSMPFSEEDIQNMRDYNLHVHKNFGSLSDSLVYFFDKDEAVQLNSMLITFDKDFIWDAVVSAANRIMLAAS